MPRFTFRFRDGVQSFVLEDEGKASAKAHQLAEEHKALVAIYRERPNGDLVGIGSAISEEQRKGLQARRNGA